MLKPVVSSIEQSSTLGCKHTNISTLISGQKRHFENECTHIFGNQKFQCFGNQMYFLNEELSDDTLPFYQPLEMCNYYFDELSSRCRHCQRSFWMPRSTFLLHTCSMMTDDLLSIGNENDLTYIPFATHATTLDNVEIIIVQNFPPRRLMIKCLGIFHSNTNDLMPTERVWKKILNMAIKALTRQDKESKDNKTAYLVDRVLGANFFCRVITILHGSLIKVREIHT